MKVKTRTPGWILAAMLLISGAVAQADVDFSLQYSPMKITVTGDGNTLVEITAFKFGGTTYNTISSERTEGEHTFINVGGKEIRITPVNRGLRFYATGSANVEVQMNDLGDHYYGVMEQLDDQGVNLDLRGHTFPVGVMHIHNERQKWATACSAFFMSTRGYGSFFDDYADGTYSFAVSGKTTLQHQTGTLDWYIFYGPTGDKIHQAYFDVIGAPKPVPIWAMGPTIWRDVNTSFADIISQAQTYTSYQYPVTHMWVDRPYSTGANDWSDMNFKSPQFDNPGGNISTIRNTYGMEFSTWISPNLWTGTLPGITKLGSGYIDLGSSSTRSAYNSRLNSQQYTYGVKGHKIDRMDEGFSKSNPWSSGDPGYASRHNKYCTLHCQTVYEGLQAVHGDDQFFFGRVAYHRSQTWMHGLWGGDVHCNYTGMRENLANALSCSYMGFPIWGADVGGYFGCYCVNTAYFDQNAANLYKRWLQWGCWNGFFEIKMGCDMPSDFAAKGFNDVLSVYQEVMERRMEMLPYIYSLANTSDRNGALMRPMTYDFPSDSTCRSYTDQYLFGPGYLVAPVTSDTQSRNVYLPAGEWVDYYNKGTTYAGGQTLSGVSAPYSRIPVYIRKNQIIPTGRIYSGNMKQWIANFDSTRYLDVEVYPGEVGETNQFIYVDYLDSDTEKNINLATYIDRVHVDFPAMTIPGTVEVWMDEAPATVVLNGSSISPSYNASTKILSVPYSASQSVDLDIYGSGGVMPTYSPPAGTYSQSLMVTVSCAQAGATIRYTTNGSDPTTSSPVYSTPISVTGDMTIKARAYYSGTTSSVSSASYIIDTVPPSMPSNLAELSKTHVTATFGWTASTDNKGVAGYRIFRGGAWIDSTSATNYTDSSLSPDTSYSYSVAAFDLAGHVSATTTPITITTDLAYNMLVNPSFEDGGSTPSDWSARGGASGTRAAENPFDGSYTLKVTGDQPGDAYFDQSIALDPSTAYELSFMISQDSVSGSGVYVRYVELTPSVLIYNSSSRSGSTGGMVPVSMVFTTSASITSGRVDIMLGGQDAGTTWLDLIDLRPYTGGGGGTVETPTISPNGGSHESSVSVTLSCGTSGAAIRYTTDGSDPTSGSTAYASAITVTNSLTLKARGFKDGMTESAVASASFTITQPDTEDPTTPTALAVTATTDDSVSLSWSASTDNVGVTGYKVYRNGSQVGTSASTTYTDTGLIPSMQYTYTVSAYDAAANDSAQSTSVGTSTKKDDGSGGAAPNLLTNPSFEDGTTVPSAWSQSGGAAGTRASDQSQDQTYAMKVEGDQAGDAYFDQTIALDPSTGYTLSFWLRQDGVTGSGVRARYVEIDPAVIQYLTPELTGTRGWEQVSVSFTTSASIANGRVDILVGGMDAGTSWLDNVYLGTGSGGGSSDSDADGIADSWENAMFGNLTTAGADTDTDGDGMTDLHEYVAATQPTNALSVLKMEVPQVIIDDDAAIRWQSVPGRTYSIEKSTNLGSSFSTMVTDLTANDAVHSITVTATDTKAYFRVKVEE